MRRRLWVAAALAPLSFAAQAHAQKTIDSGTTTPITTSGAGGDVILDSDGSITLTTAVTPPAAITVNTNNNVVNGGILSISGVSNISGIQALGGNTGAVSITNTDEIVVTETTNYKDTNGDDIIDENGSNTNGTDLWASGTNRYGIYVNGLINGVNEGPFGSTANSFAQNQGGFSTTSGAIEGTLVNTGEITVLGQASAGIYVDAGGLNGDLVNTGTIAVTGGNPGTTTVASGTAPAAGSTAFLYDGLTSGLASYGIHITGQVNGNVNVAGSVSATGENAQAVSVQGEVTGQVAIWGTLTATGYESTSPPIPSSSLQSLMQSQAAEELIQGGPALYIGGSVLGGVNLVEPVPATGTTSATTGASITVYGSAPAVLIGGAVGSTITLGEITGNAISNSNTYGMVVGGTVTATNDYPFLDIKNTPVSATGLAIGGFAVGNSSAQVLVGTGVNAYYQSELITGSNQAYQDLGQVNIAGEGISIIGSVAATTIGGQVLTDPYDTTLAAKAIDTPTGDAIGVFLDKVTAANLDVGGGITATIETQTLDNGTIHAPTATGVLLAPNANVATINNGGVISAEVTGLESVVIPSNGGTQGYAYAINDQSGNLLTVNNYDTIEAHVVPINPQDIVNPAYASAVAVQFNNTTAVATLNQLPYPQSTAPTETSSTTTTSVTITPTIIGDVLFGSGGGNLNLQAGLLSGGVQFAASANNTLTIGNGAITLGQLAEGQGGSMNVYVGVAANSSGQIVQDGTGVLGMDTPVGYTLWSSQHMAVPTAPSTTVAQAALGVGNLHIGNNGQVIFGVFAPSASFTTFQNTQVVAPQFNVSGAVQVDSGGQIGLSFVNKLNSTTTYDLIEAAHGSITVANAATAVGDMPYLYDATLAVTQNAAQPSQDFLALTVSKKSLAELGLNPAQTSAFNAFYAAFDAPDSAGSGAGTVTSAVLAQTTKQGFDHLYNEFLPDYSGGPFDTLVQTQDALASAETDGSSKLSSDGVRGWVQEIGVADNRSSQDVVGYSGRGFGFAGGTETISGRNAAGVAMAMITTEVGDDGRPTGSSQAATVVEGGVYWRNSGDGLNLGAALNGGWAFMESHRVLLQQVGTSYATLFEDAKAHWNGGIVSAQLDMSYKETIGRFFIQPEAEVEAVALYESAYAESGAGQAVDLAVNSRLSQEGVAQADLVMGASFGTVTKWTPSLTIGWREIAWGGAAATTAHFEQTGAQSFTLAPDFDEKGGLLARLGLRATGPFADFSANAGGVFANGYDAVDARATARFLF